MNDKPPLPGTFHNTPELSMPEKPKIDPKPEASRELVKKYTMFRETFHPKENVVFYPSCDLDVSPSMAFPDSRVIYVDINTEAIKKLRAAGYEAYRASATEELSDPPIAAFSPQNVDILILLNPAINPEIPLETIPEKGYVLCNDYHSTASAIHDDKNFQLAGLIRREPKTKELVVDTDHPEEYWKEIDTDEEFKNAPFSFSVAHYKYAAEIVKEITGKSENVLQEYKHLLELAQQQMAERDPDGQYKEEREAMPFLTLEWGGKRFDLVTGLPRKKGTVDDIFIFQRIHQSKI